MPTGSLFLPCSAFSTARRRPRAPCVTWRGMRSGWRGRQGSRLVAKCGAIPRGLCTLPRRLQAAGGSPSSSFRPSTPHHPDPGSLTRTAQDTPRSRCLLPRCPRSWSGWRIAARCLWPAREREQGWRGLGGRVVSSSQRKATVDPGPSRRTTSSSRRRSSAASLGCWASALRQMRPAGSRTAARTWRAQGGFSPAGPSGSAAAVQAAGRALPASHPLRP